MGEKNNDQSIMDKSMRSVFGKLFVLCKFIGISHFIISRNAFLFFLYRKVGNIPYEATEDKLKEIFSEVGPVISLK